MESQAVHMMILLLIFLVLLIVYTCAAAAAQEVYYPKAKPGCQENCSDVFIPYPFGIGHTDCYLDDWFEIECRNQSSKTTSSAPDYKPFLKRAQLEVLNISIGGPRQAFGGPHQAFGGPLQAIGGTLQVNSPVTFFCNGNGSSQVANLTGSPFVYSQDKNRFTAVSCGILALMISANDFVVGGCRSVCDNQKSAYCDIGINCCQTTIPPYLTMMGASILYQPKTRKADCNDYAFLVDKYWFESERSPSAHEIKNRSKVPVVLEWNIINSTSSFALFGSYVQEDFDLYYYNYTYGFAANPFCKIYTLDSNNRSKIYCRCPRGFVGNPYLLQTCQVIRASVPKWDLDSTFEQKNDIAKAVEEELEKAMSHYGFEIVQTLIVDIEPDEHVKRAMNEINADIDECIGDHRCGPHSDCVNTPGYYLCHDKKNTKLIVIVGLGAGLGLLLLLMGAWFGYRFLKKRHTMKRREMFFKRNGGLLLEKQLSSGEVNVEKIKLFK
ncbi:hypothetical protein ACE6H2_011397 [Prunus campanulata]